MYNQFDFNFTRQHCTATNVKTNTYTHINIGRGNDALFIRARFLPVRNLTAACRPFVCQRTFVPVCLYFIPKFIHPLCETTKSPAVPPVWIITLLKFGLVPISRKSYSDPWRNSLWWSCWKCMFDDARTRYLDLLL